MSPLHMVECLLDPVALLRFLRAQGLEDPRRDPDFGYGVHAWLRAAFGERAPQPWRLLADGKQPVRLLGYGGFQAEALAECLVDFAEPAVFAVCPPEAIAGKPMPKFRKGRLLNFEVLVCPVGRKARSGVEKDLFLLHADPAGGKLDAALNRSQLYCDWTAERLQRTDAVQIQRISLNGYRRVRQLRRGQKADGTRQLQSLERPEALVRGRLQVDDSDRFSQLLRRGIGRHRAFDYGMLLLKPTRS